MSQHHWLPDLGHVLLVNLSCFFTAGAASPGRVPARCGALTVDMDHRAEALCPAGPLETSGWADEFADFHEADACVKQLHKEVAAWWPSIYLKPLTITLNIIHIE